MGDELHQRAGTVRALEERANDRVMVSVRDSSSSDGTGPGIPMGGSGTIFSFEADKSLGFEIGETVTITVTRGEPA